MSVINLNSSIRAVTVYRYGATVTRQARLEPDLAEGAVLRLMGLPLSLHDSSLRSRVVAAPGCSFLASDVQVVLDAPAISGGPGSEASIELKRLRKEVRRLEGQSTYLNEELAIRLAVVQRPPGVDGNAPSTTPLQARLALVDFSETRLQDLQAEHMAVHEELLRAAKRLQELEDEQERMSNQVEAQQHELRKAALVTTQGRLTLGDEARLEIEYFVPGAAWAPSYAIKLGAELKRGMLSMRALVSQRSGEDWRGVELTLSTADALGWAEVPELRSRRVGRRQAPQPKVGWRARPPGLEGLYADYDNAFADPGARGSEPSMARAVMASTVSREMLVGAANEDFDDEITGVMSDSLDGYMSDEPMPAPSMPARSMSLMMDRPAELEEVTRVSPARERKAEKLKKLSRPAAKAAYSMQAPGGGGRGGGGGDHEGGIEAQAASASYDNPLLSYARLRMPPARSAERGTLQETSTRAYYAESFSDPSLAQRVVDIYEDQVMRASDLAALPTGHRRPFCEDYDYAFNAESRLDVTSDGRFHSLPIQQRESEGQALHIVVPRESTDVFRMIKMRNPFDGPLLSGPIDVYWAGDFLLTSNLEFTPPKGQVELGLGVDQAVKVARNTHYREDTVGMMGGSLELTHKIVIEVSNGGAHAIDLHVRERVPVPAKHEEDDIKVEVKNVLPAWQPYQPLAEHASESSLRGGHVWELHLDRGELAELSVSYEIKMSSKLELRGGNRREW